jgi:acyl dehydratase
VKYFEDFQVGDKTRTRRRTITETDKKDNGAFGGVVSFDSRIRNRKDEDAAVYRLKIVMSHRPTD